MKAIFIIVSVLCIVCIVKAQSTFSQRVTLYENKNCNKVGAKLTIKESYTSNLAELGWTKRSSSATVTGIWLFYENNNYNLNGGLAEYSFGVQVYCINHIHLYKKVSSIRFAGSPNNYRADTLNLYEGTYFMGQEEYIQGNLPYLALTANVKSIIVSGHYTNGWTLYDEEEYNGNSICIFPPKADDYRPGFFVDVAKDLNIPHNTIRSVKKGCYNNNVQKSIREVFASPVDQGSN